MSENQAKVEGQTLGGGTDGIVKASDDKTSSHERENGAHSFACAINNLVVNSGDDVMGICFIQRGII